MNILGNITEVKKSNYLGLLYFYKKKTIMKPIRYVLIYQWLFGSKQLLSVVILNLLIQSLINTKLIVRKEKTTKVILQLPFLSRDLYLPFLSKMRLDMVLIISSFGVLFINFNFAWKGWMETQPYRHVLFWHIFVGLHNISYLY